MSLLLQNVCYVLNGGLSKFKGVTNYKYESECDIFQTKKSEYYVFIWHPCIIKSPPHAALADRTGAPKSCIESPAAKFNFEHFAPFRHTLPWESPRGALGTLFPQFPPRHQ